LVVAEMAANRVLHGELPCPQYPEALRRHAPEQWWGTAQLTLTYAKHGHLTDCVGAIATAACQTAHAVMAARGEWVTNEKTLLDRAGLRSIERILANLAPDPQALTAAIDETATLLKRAVEAT
jgi:hypothetical protein